VRTKDFFERFFLTGKVSQTDFVRISHLLNKFCSKKSGLQLPHLDFGGVPDSHSGHASVTLVTPQPQNGEAEHGAVEAEQDQDGDVKVKLKRQATDLKRSDIRTWTAEQMSTPQAISPFVEPLQFYPFMSSQKVYQSMDQCSWQLRLGRDRKFWAWAGSWALYFVLALL
jgi:hypothetical protein